MKVNQSAEMLTTLSLIGSSTGTLKVTELINEGGLHWLIPSSIVLLVSSLESSSVDKVAYQDYQDYQLKAYDLTQGSAGKSVVLEGTDPKRRMAILVTDAKEYSIRISQLPDAAEQPEAPFIKEAVSFEGRTIVVPDINALADHLYGTTS
jgi:hypothetical protein